MNPTANVYAAAWSMKTITRTAKRATHQEKSRPLTVGTKRRKRAIMGSVKVACNCWG